MGIAQVDVNQTASLWILISRAVSTIAYIVKRIAQFSKEQNNLKETVSELKVELADQKVCLNNLIKAVTPNGGDTMNNGDITLRTERKVDAILRVLEKGRHNGQL